MKQEKKLRLRVLSKENVDRIHEGALRILNEVGVSVHDEDTRKSLENVGCREGDDGFLLFDQEIVEQAISTVPSRMVLYDRNGEPAVDTGGNIPHFSPGAGCKYVLDHQTGRHRLCLLKDVSQTARVCEKLQHINLVLSLGYPNDVAANDEGLATVKAMLDQTSKPIGFIAHDDAESSKIWHHLSEVAGGWVNLSARPFALELTGPTSPLTLGKEACKRLRAAAARNLPVVCYPALLPGASGPLTLPGALAQSASEVLAGIVVHQLENPGSPVVTGSAVIPLDLRTAGIAYGAPEYSLACLAASDYFESIGIPSWVGAGCSDAHTIDSQAVAEAATNILAAVLSGTSLVHNLGFLSSGKAGSLEMLILCDELAGMSARIGAGMQVNDDTLAIEVVERAAQKCSYLTDKHTVAHLRDESWLPSLFQRLQVEQWIGCRTMSVNDSVRDRLRALLQG